MKLNEITNFLASIAPPALQENYDNAGLLTGNMGMEITSCLVTLDIVEDTIDEAIRHGCQLIISHHPLVFGGLKSFTGRNLAERALIKAIKNDIAIYTMHTNLDNVPNGVNKKICDKIGLVDTSILVPAKDSLSKLVTFVPTEHLEIVQQAVFESGAGTIGDYDQCSFNLEGTGTFRGNENANPFVGKKGELHHEKEARFETIFPNHLSGQVIQALLNSHPYEEVAYDIYPLLNENPLIGAGMIGQLPSEMDEKQFLALLKKEFNCQAIRHTTLPGKTIKKVAVCGGSGSQFLKHATRQKADIYITGDFKYHQFFEAENRIVIADIGHYESEIFTIELIYEFLTKNFPNFAVRLTEYNTNPINYF